MASTSSFQVIDNNNNNEEEEEHKSKPKNESDNAYYKMKYYEYLSARQRLAVILWAWMLFLFALCISLLLLQLDCYDSLDDVAREFQVAIVSRHDEFRVCKDLAPTEFIVGATRELAWPQRVVNTTGDIQQAIKNRRPEFFQLADTAATPVGILLSAYMLKMQVAALLDMVAWVRLVPRALTWGHRFNPWQDALLCWNIPVCVIFVLLIGAFKVLGADNDTCLLCVKDEGVAFLTSTCVFSILAVMALLAWLWLSFKLYRNRNYVQDGMHAWPSIRLLVRTNTR